MLFEGVLTNCAANEGIATYSSQGIHFRVLGVSRTESMPQRMEIEIDSRADACATG